MEFLRFLAIKCLRSRVRREFKVQNLELRLKVFFFFICTTSYIHAISIFRPEIVQVESASEWATKNNRIITCDVFNLISLER